MSEIRQATSCMVEENPFFWSNNSVMNGSDQACKHRRHIAWFKFKESRGKFLRRKNFLIGDPTHRAIAIQENITPTATDGIGWIGVRQNTGIGLFQLLAHNGLTHRCDLTPASASGVDHRGKRRVLDKQHTHRALWHEPKG
jgi:hypothetical protein